MDHAVAVGPDNYQIVQAGFSFSGLAQRNDVLVLGNALTPFPIHSLKVESTSLASQLASGGKNLGDLLSHPSSVPLMPPVKLFQNAAFIEIVILLVGVEKSEDFWLHAHG
ncbi:hypothetical protein GCM10008949_36120 [Deinococcus humi]|nr:hypothetical protein GCM10008949_36120 [Deinococcus humi]